MDKTSNLAPPPRGSAKRMQRMIRYVSALALLVGFGQPAFSQAYCPSDGGSGNVINIDRVVLGDLNNSSGDNDGYGDFTALSVTATAGTALPVTLDPSGPFFLRYRWRAWLDLNNDGTFDNAERVLQVTGFGVQNGSVNIPSGTPDGNYRMRISMKAFSYAEACDNYAAGDVEDYTLSVISACDAVAGAMSTSKPDVCFSAGGVTLVANPDGAAFVPQGFSQAYVLTSGAGLVIEQLGATPEFTVTSPGIYTIHSFVFPSDLDLSIVVPGTTTGFDVNSLLIQGGGSLCASLDVTGAQFNVADPMAGTMSGGADACFNGDEATLTATANGDANVPAGYSQAYVLTSGAGLVIEQLGATPEFTVTSGGLYTIHSFVFPSDLDLSVVVPGTTTGFDVNGLLVQGGGSLCASLDVAGAQFNVTDPMAGTMSGGADVCFNGDNAMLMATANGDANVPAGYSQAYVLTSGAGLVIEQLGATPEFIVTTGGLYTIHSFVFPSDLDLSVVVPGTTTGFDVNGLLVQGGGSLCASLDVAGAQFNVTDPMAGTMSGGADACLQGDGAVLVATANGDANVPAGYSQAYVLTSGAGLVIDQLGATPAFTVTTGGLYTIHSFVFPSDLDLSVVVPGTTTGFDVNGLLVQGGGSLCASLDVAGAQFNVTDPMAGTMSGGADFCLQGDGAVLVATANGDANVPAGYSQAYVLTSGAGLVIEQLGATPEFTVTTGGLYTIHSFVFPSDLDLSVVVPGTTTGFDVNGLLVQGGGSLCASLDVAGAQFNVTDPMAGTMSGGADACFNGDEATLTATANGDANVPAGYSQAYVLTSGAGLVIEQLGATPEFTVTTGGLYTIHSFVFPSDLDLSVVVLGVTTGFDVNGLLVQGGGELCASLDVAGAQFNVVDPMAGTMSGGGDACLVDGSAMLMATANGDANVPTGYSQAYVLTSGAGLVIEQLGATPEFTVTSGGLYTIHSFVFPSDLDLSVVVPGTTTGFDVNGLLVQGGGSLCASLDVAGTQFNVAECACTADAGTLTAVSDEACLVNGQVTISANVNGDANVPAGYSQAYVLTSGTGLVIEQLGATPEFTVTSGGLYTIHSFVFPSDLDLSIVVPGVTTGFDVNGLLIQGGGALCASLDVAGAPVQVSGPYAGNIDPDNFLSCLNNGTATLNGNPAGDAQVPAGYNTVYVLTRGQGLVIVNAGPTPEFNVTTPGLYRIHTVVYDPNTLDLGIVVLGTTTGFDVNSLLVQGGGTICASLDVQGAPFLVLNGWICNWFLPFFNSDGMDPMDQLSDALGRDARSLSDEDLKMLTSEVPVQATLYPVPATDILNIRLDSRLAMQMEVSVMDMSGRIVRGSKSYDLEAGVRDLTIDVNDLENGNYIVRMVANGEVLTEQFVKVQ